MQEVKEKICKLRVNKHRLELRKIQIASRALNIESKIKANEADLMKLSSVEDGVGTDSKDVKWTDTTNKLIVTHAHTRRAPCMWKANIVGGMPCLCTSKFSR